jgi:copper chaperone CopZ
MKRIATTLVLLLTATMLAFAAPKTEEIKIQTSSVCGMCKETIETAFAYEKGVKSAVLDVDSGILTVVYNPKKTNPDIIRTAVTMVGYDADAMPADSAAYAGLHACCKKDSHH